MAPRETGNNAYSNFWGDKQRALWYVMVFSGVVNCCPCWMQTFTGQTTRVAEKYLLYGGQMMLIQQWLNPV